MKDQTRLVRAHFTHRHERIVAPRTVKVLERRHGEEFEFAPLLREQLDRLVRKTLHRGIRAHVHLAHARLRHQMRHRDRRVARRNGENGQAEVHNRHLVRVERDGICGKGVSCESVLCKIGGDAHLRWRECP